MVILISLTELLEQIQNKKKENKNIFESVKVRVFTIWFLFEILFSYVITGLNIPSVSLPFYAVIGWLNTFFYNN